MDRELLLLGLLRQQEMHGYQLAEFIQRDLASCTALKKPTAYYLLERMEKDGWIKRSTEREGNRPERNVYSLTPEGDAAFDHLLRENLAAYQAPAFENDIGLAFVDALPREEAHALLNKRREALAARLDEARAIPTHAGSHQFVIQHLVHHLTGEMAWLNEVLATLAGTTSQPE